MVFSGENRASGRDQVLDKLKGLSRVIVSCLTIDVVLRSLDLVRLSLVQSVPEGYKLIFPAPLQTKEFHPVLSFSVRPVGLA